MTIATFSFEVIGSRFYVNNSKGIIRDDLQRLNCNDSSLGFLPVFDQCNLRFRSLYNLKLYTPRVLIIELILRIGLS